MNSVGPTRTPLRRKFKIGAFVVFVGTLVLVAYVGFFAGRNALVEREWDRWTNHPTASPPGAPVPSSDLQHFKSSTRTVKTRYGRVYEAWGYDALDGTIVIEPRFIRCAKRFYDGLAWAKDKNGRSGWIAEDGEWAIVIYGRTTSDFEGGMGKFSVPGSHRTRKYGFVNRQGDVVVPPRFQTAMSYVDGYVLVRERTWFGAMSDRIGSAIGAPRFPPRIGIETRSMILDQSGAEVVLPRR